MARKYKHLSEQDHQYIKDNYQNMTAAAIAKALDCSASYVKQQCSILKYAKRKKGVQPEAASLHKAPPSTDIHPIEPAPEIVPGLIVKGTRPVDHEWERTKLYIEVKKRLYGTYRNPIYRMVEQEGDGI